VTWIRCALSIFTICLALAAPASALAGDDVRANGTCGRAASSTLRLKPDDGSIRVEFRVRHNRLADWRVTLVQEGRVVWRGRARTRGSSRSFRVRREIDDLAGADRITARAVGPGGITCVASATLPEAESH
jgi:hypothetical protein